ncbi:MAG: glycosyltransferase [Ruminococcaceae bacterium]|nr:glycosyltransferase [Oscillospiraceae bacterium]
MDNKISIIVPAYNIEAYLPATLDSVLAQTYPNIEVVVVNDGSKDGTGAVIDRYAAQDRRVKAIHKENGGVTSARLRGVAEASGQWIGFVDGDDLIEPQMYERLMENALKHGADISHCGYQMVFPSRVDYYYNTGKLVEQDHAAGLRDLVAGGFVEPGLWNKLYRREIFAGLEQCMDFSFKINEDILMNYWLFKASKRSVFEDVCPYHYVLRPGSAATSKLNPHKLRDPLGVLHAILADADGSLRPVVMARLTRQLIANASMSADDEAELIKPFRAECRKELRQRLFSILSCSACGMKLKLMALFTAIWPGGYGLIHGLYAKATGIDKIYNIK